MEKGYLVIVLHAHLPYVRHPEHEHFLEEKWFYEAMTESYIPLLKAMDALARDGVDFRLTLSLTPTLLSMMTDPLLQDRYVRHLDSLIELADKEVRRTSNEPVSGGLARMYRGLFGEAREIFCGRYQKDLTRAFKEWMERGQVEIITSAATHGFLPLMEICPEAVRAQIRVGVQTHRRIFGRDPRGIWLPECGYYPGLDQILKEEGLRFFILETHGILFATPRPRYGVHAPVYCPSGVAAFGRDRESSKSVWSAEEGYPGDPIYREFYRDIGFDLDYEYVRPYLNGDGARIQTGLKYFRITGSAQKEPYAPAAALEKAAAHAGNFLFNREKQIEHLHSLMKKPPIVLAPYDAELFGHWWFEGPRWLEFLLRKIHSEGTVFKTITPSGYLEKYPEHQTVNPPMSSWGYNGYAEVWLNPSNDWIYRPLHEAARRMTESARHFPDPSVVRRRALNQMARELLLAQASDWAFIMKTGTHTDYAVRRTREHLARFTRLWEELNKNSMDIGHLESIESMDNLFPDIDYQIYANRRKEREI